jgi:hypothetical protein
LNLRQIYDKRWQKYANLCKDMLGFSENASAVEMPESGVKSRKTSIFKEFKIHDKNFIHLPRQYHETIRKSQ